MQICFSQLWRRINLRSSYWQFWYLLRTWFMLPRWHLKRCVLTWWHVRKGGRDHRAKGPCCSPLVLGVWGLFSHSATNASIIKFLNASLPESVFPCLCLQYFWVFVLFSSSHKCAPVPTRAVCPASVSWFFMASVRTV